VAFIIDPQTMGIALERAGAGDRFYFARESFVFGMAAHVIVAGVLGLLFTLVAMRLRLRGTRALAGGLVYGLVVMALMSALVLPQAAAFFGAGEPISRMGSEIGWATFAVLHAVFGLSLGAWLYLRPQDLEGVPRRAAALTDAGPDRPGARSSSGTRGVGEGSQAAVAGIGSPRLWAASGPGRDGEVVGRGVPSVEEPGEPDHRRVPGRRGRT
jgi:hypothetical protein